MGRSCGVGGGPRMARDEAAWSVRDAGDIKALCRGSSEERATPLRGDFGWSICGLQVIMHEDCSPKQFVCPPPTARDVPAPRLTVCGKRLWPCLRHRTRHSTSPRSSRSRHRLTRSGGPISRSSGRIGGRKLIPLASLRDGQFTSLRFNGPDCPLPPPPTQGLRREGSREDEKGISCSQ